MTREDKISAGWVETAPNVWRLPDGAPDRSEENGYGHGKARVRAGADGTFVAHYPDGWRTTLTGPRDGAPVRVTAEQRSARLATIIARARFVEKRRRIIMLADLMVTLAESGDTHRRAPILRANGLPFRDLRTGRPLTRRESMRVIAHSVIREGVATQHALTVDRLAVDAARKRLSRTRENVSAALRRETDRRRDAARRAAETPEQREARLARQREAQRILRAKRRAAKVAATA